MDQINAAVELVVEKAHEIFKETFYKIETDEKPTTRNFNVTTLDKLITTVSMSAMVYLCLVFGCWGSIILRKKENNNDYVEFISKSAAKKSPIIASCTLFGLFILTKIIPTHYLISVLTYYVVIFSSLQSYIVIEECLLMFLRVPVDNYSLTINIKNQSLEKSLFKYVSKFNVYTLFSVPVAIAICVWYILSDKFWIANNFIAIFICIYAISAIQLQKLSHGVILLVGLLFYDIFWVFGTNVMVSVATKIDAPIKLLFPNDFSVEGVFSKSHSLIGLGDIVLPGIYLAFLLKYDESSFENRHPFFNVGLFFYGIGLTLTHFVLYYFQSGQPALLYLVPSLLLGTIVTAVYQKHASQIWSFEDVADNKDGADDSSDNKNENDDIADSDDSAQTYPTKKKTSTRTKAKKD